MTVTLLSFSFLTLWITVPPSSPTPTCTVNPGHASGVLYVSASVRVCENGICSWEPGQSVGAHGNLFRVGLSQWDKGVDIRVVVGNSR